MLALKRAISEGCHEDVLEIDGAGLTYAVGIPTSDGFAVGGGGMD